MNNRPPHQTAAATGVSVSPFDASVDNFFAAIDEISALCGSTSSSPTEIQRFSSMITFLKEWRYFQYKSRTVNFVYHKEAREPVRGVNLSQFSSVAVPMEHSPEKSTLDGKDFVLYAGGPVWALDWCPRSAETSGSDIKCEYLAVAAHPPDSVYHKMGKPLIGRGIIQIWCLVNIVEKDEKVESLALPTGRKFRGRPRKRPVEEEPLEMSVAEDTSYVPNKRPNVAIETHGTSLVKPKKKPVSGSSGSGSNGPARPRGRPRKHPLPDLTNLNGQEGLASRQQCPNVDANVDVPLAVHASNDKNRREEPVVKKRRGRPRKYPLPDVSGNDKSILGQYRVNVDVDVPLAILASNDKKVEEESAVKKPRGRARKHPLLVLTNSSGQEESAPGQHCLNIASADDKGKEKWVVLKRCGSPRKNPIPNLNNSSPASGVELDKDTYTKLPSPVGHESTLLNASSIDLKGIPLALPAFTDLSGKGEILLPRCRGKPGRKPIHDSDECVTSSSVDLKEDALELPNTTDSNNPSMKSLNADLAEDTLALLAVSDLNDKNDKSLPKKRGRSRKNPTPDVNQSVPTSGVELLGADVSAVPSQEKLPGVIVEPSYKDKIFAVPSQEKQSGVTIEPSYKDRMILCEEVMSSRVTNTNTTRLIVPRSIALPRVVLCLAHNGKVAWDVKWRPNTSESQQRMGYLAVLLGNGSLEVWDVPFPNTVKSLYASCCREGTDPRFMVLKPVFRCSKLKCGDKQSIPLTVEWSPSGSCDLIVAGCHDGTVALWKFSAHYPSQDTKPLLCFTADSVPIRALSWASEESDIESANVIVTAGHEGLKFWDLRDPYRPLWEFYPVQRAILSMDWLKEPRCIILSFDDGSLRTVSLMKVVSDVPVTGKNSTVTKPPGVHSHQCSSFAIWSVQMSRATGLVAYCSADGTTLCFQLTTKAIEKETHRNPQPHFLCSSLIEEGQTLNISTPLPSTPCFDIPPSVRKSLRDYGDASRTVVSNRSDAKEAQQVKSQFPALSFGGNELTIVPGHGDGDSLTPPERKSTTCSKTKKPKPNASSVGDQALLHGDQQHKVENFPSKIMAMHRVRWNMNKGSERWLCYGGAAGIVRCQAIGLPRMP